VAIAVAALALLTAVSFARVAVAEYQLNQQKAELQRQVAALQAENQQLQQQYAALQTDAAVEKLAREQLGWTAPDDTAVIIQWAGTAAPTVQPPATPTPEQRPTWRQWWDRFSGT
jgi:cell division protein FtsL